MSRRLRVLFDGAVHHVVHNGHEERLLFRDDQDRACFLRLLAKTLERYGIECWSYSLLGTHYHAIFHDPHSNLSIAMQFLHGRYATEWNRRAPTCDAVWKGRFWSTPILTERHLKVCARYIALNAVAAGLVDTPAEWRWCSHRAICRGERSAVLEPGRLLAVFGDGGADGASAYRAFVAAATARELQANPRRLGDDRPPLGDVLESSPTPAAYVLAHRTFGYTLRELAAHTGLSPATIHRRMRETEGV